MREEKSHQVAMEGAGGGGFLKEPGPFSSNP